MPLCNRLTWFEVVFNLKAWGEKMLDKYGPASDIFVAFLNWRKELAHTFDPAVSSKVFASPRSWEEAIRTWMTDMPEAIKHAAISGEVGAGPQAEFLGFVEVWEKVVKLIPAILKNPDKVEVPEEPSMAYALCMAISGNLAADNADVYNKFLLRMPAEFIVLAWQMAVKRDKPLFHCAAFIDFSRKYKAVFIP